MQTKAEKDELELLRSYVTTLPRIKDMRNMRDYVI